MSNNLFEKADLVVREMYKITLSLKQIYQFSVGEQLRRASLSVVLNIVEGGARRSHKEKLQLLSVSFGSLKECKYLLYFMFKLGLLDKKTYESIMIRINELARIIYSILYKNKK